MAQHANQTETGNDPERQEQSTSENKRAPLTEPTRTDQSGPSAVREVAQSQPDQVAIVSRTATGLAAQSPGYDVIGLPEDADEKLRAAAENRPEHAGGN